MFDNDQKCSIYSAYLDGYADSATWCGKHMRTNMSSGMGEDTDTGSSLSEQLAYTEGLNDGRLTGEHGASAEIRSASDLLAVVTAKLNAIDLDS